MSATSTRSWVTLLPNRLTGIDESNVEPHHYLNADDPCYFFGEYYGQESYKGGPTNQLISNFKIKPSVAKANSSRAYHKAKALRTIAAVVRQVIPQQNAERLTWVPIPTSKTPTHADYDTRLVDTLSLAFRHYDADIRPMLRQSRDTDADHENNLRLSKDELLGIIELNPDGPMDPAPQGIVLFDDLLTTGKHYKCCEHRLHEVFPDTPIYGVFAARRIFRE